MFKSRDAIGKRLRFLRERAGYSGREFAKRLRYNQSFISKIESGKAKPTSQIVGEYCRALKLSGREERDLLAMTESFLFSFDRWSWTDQAGARSQERVSHRVEQSTTIDTYSHHIMSGFLQSKEYIRGVFEIDAPTLTKVGVDAAISNRLKWQQLRTDPNKQIRVITSEFALGNWILDREQMKEQLNELVLHIQEGKIEVRIVPQSSRQRALPIGPFTIYDNLIVTVETQTMELAFWETEELAEYRRLFDSLLVHSVTGRAAIQIVKSYVLKLGN